MSRSVFYILLYMGMLVVPAYSQQADVFDEGIMISYAKAFELNESKDYLVAYREIIQTERAVDRALSLNKVTASNLGDYEFWNIYWPIKKSKAEIAYMLGIHTDMKAVSAELREALEGKKWENDDEETVHGIVNGLRADLAKIDGCSDYLVEQYDACEASLLRALALSPQYGNDFFVNKVHDDLAQLYYKREAYDRALAHLDSILASPLYAEAISRNKESQRNIMLVKSQRALCLARLGRYEEAIAIIEPIVLAYKQQDMRLYAEALRKKAKMLMLQYDATGQYDSQAKRCYQEYLAVSRAYIDEHFIGMNESEREQYWMAEQPFVTDCFRLEDKAPELLYDVALYSKAVLLQMGREFKEGMTGAERKAALSAMRVTWQQIRGKLPADGCAIEFVTYEKKGENHLGAVVVNKYSKTPRFIEVGSVKTIGEHLVASRWMVRDVLADTQTKDKINSLYNDSTLRHLIWNDHLVAAVGNCSEVFFAPDGLFHQFGIEYLTPQSMAGKHLYRLTTTRMLMQPGGKVKTDRMMVCGGIDYTLSVTDREPGNDEQAYSLLSAMDMSVQPLPNSSVELDSILAIRHGHLHDFALRADSVTEQVLHALLGKYHIVHLSTHGLFAEVAKMGTDIHPSSTDVQLSKSCLFLSGSEKNLNQQDYDASYHDGVLSARELAKMDLQQVDLTVLSACMSGLGYITPDGVYGLQRGLKTAGVKAIVSTLWSVDDEATSLFMMQLYKNLEKGKGLRESFWNAREFLKNYEKTFGGTSSNQDSARGSFTQRRRITIQKFNKPYYYNAFILIDGI